MEKTLERLSQRMPGWARNWSKRRLAGAAAVVVLVVVVAVSCVGGSGGRAADVPVLADGANTGVTDVRSPSREPGGTLRVVAPEITSLDPQRSYQPGVWNLMRLYARTLVTYASEPRRTGELVPDLATDLGTPSEDGRTWTFTLKSGITFENGAPITSRDVKYGIERTFASDVIVGGPTHVVELLDDPANPYAGPYLEASEGQPDLTAVETPDDVTIVFHLRRPAPEFPYLMALPSSSPVPAAADTREKYGRDPVSSGPYMITINDPVTGIVLDRNPQWDPATDEVRTALPDRVVVRTNLTGLERDQALLAGSADVDISGTGIQTATTARLTDEEGEDELLGDRLDDLTTGTVRLLAMPTNVAPMDQPACRQAVAAVVDRAAVQVALGGGINAVRTSQLWPRLLSGAPDDPDPRADVAAARAGLAECGQPEGFQTVMAVADVPSSIDVAEVLAAQLAEIGIEVEIRAFPLETFYATDVGRAGNVTGHRYGLVLATWTADSPTPASFLAPLVDGRSIRADVGNTNHAQLNVPAINALVDEARAAGDTPEAEDLWWQVAATARDTHAYVPLTEARVQLVAGQRLRNGLVMQPYSSYDLATAGVR